MAPEQGHVRVPNRLYEAMISAGFRDTQKDIVHAITRLTIGWQRHTVVLSHAELAEYIGLRTVSGGFRTALRDLIRQGVVAVMSSGGGADRNAYALRVDYTTWGRYALSGARLEAIWGKRPVHSDDQLPLQILELHPDSGESGGVAQAGQRGRLGRVRGGDSGESGSPGAKHGAASGSGRRKSVTPTDTQQQVDRAGAQELLTAIEDLKERISGQSSKWVIRRDRIREQLGADVDEALRMAGGVERVLTTQPQYRSILTTDFMVALNRIRAKAAIA